MSGDSFWRDDENEMYRQMYDGCSGCNAGPDDECESGCGVSDDGRWQEEAVQAARADIEELRHQSYVTGREHERRYITEWLRSDEDLDRREALHIAVCIECCEHLRGDNE